MALLLPIFLAVVLAAVGVWLIKRKARKLPGPDGIPVLGNVLQMDPALLHDQFDAWADKYGKVYELFFINTRTVCVSDYEVAKKLLFSRPDAFTRIDMVRKALNEIGALGLFGLEGETWKRHRRLIMPAFVKSTVNRMHYCIEIPVERLIEKWRRQVEASADGSVVITQPRQEMGRLTLDVITYLTCGMDLNSVQKGETSLSLQLAEFFASLNDRVMPSLSQMFYRMIPGWDRGFQKTKAAVTKVINEIIESTKQQLADEKAGKIEGGRSNLLREMIRASVDDEALTDEELRHEILTIMLAGYDTTSILLSWSLVMLSQHPKWLHTLRQEILDVVGETQIPSPDQIAKLTMTSYFLQETLRLRGPAPFNTVQNVDAVTIADGVEIEPGANFFILGRKMLGSMFSDPEVFRPERWSDPKLSSDTQSAFVSLLPFGGGTRVCPGRQLALSEATAALAAIVRAFDIELVGDMPKSELVFVAMPTPFSIKLRLAKST